MLYQFQCQIGFELNHFNSCLVLTIAEGEILAANPQKLI